MEFSNRTSFAALQYDAVDQHGALFHVVVMRQTFRITAAGLVREATQVPIRDTDDYFDAKLRQSVRQESDLCPFKPKSDVVVNAVAYAPRGTPSRRFQVRVFVETPGASVGLADALGSNSVRESGAARARVIDKALVVTGERRIVKQLLPVRMCASLLGLATLGLVRVPPWRVTRPAQFMSLPMRYELAFGGENLVEADGENRSKQIRKIGKKSCLTPEQMKQHPMAAGDAGAPVAHAAHEENPTGVGFAMQWYLKHCGVRSLPAPRVEYPGEPFSAKTFWNTAREKGTVHPAGIGAVGRAWLPRRALIGNFDANSQWDETEFPFLPPEFDHQYWNCAPFDQQCAHLQGDEFFTFINLSAQGSVGSQTIESGDNVLCFQLPGMRPFLAIGDVDERIGVKPCVLDTVYVDPEIGSVELVWRATIPAEVCPAAMQLRVADTEIARTQLETVLRASAMDDGDIQPTFRG